jgi:hypothetical protein
LSDNIFQLSLFLKGRNGCQFKGDWKEGNKHSLDSLSHHFGMEAEDLKREEADYYCESPIDWYSCNQSFFHDAVNYSRGSRSKNEL